LTATRHRGIQQSPFMSDTATPLATDPVKQFSVFLPNRVGQLYDLTALLAKHNVHVMAMTTLDTTDQIQSRNNVAPLIRTTKL
jgi:hypothetical protein